MLENSMHLYDPDIPPDVAMALGICGYRGSGGYTPNMNEVTCVFCAVWIVQSMGVAAKVELGKRHE